MVYVVKFKSAGRTRQSILRICTEESECFKLKSDGSKVSKRNCEFWPTCKCQKHAELIAYRPVLCNGIKVPRITCRWDGSSWVTRNVGTNPASTRAKDRDAAERKTAEGHEAVRRNEIARRDEQRRYYSEHRTELIASMRKYNDAHRVEQREYRRKYYLEHKK